jgi:hypothetical protein
MESGRVRIRPPRYLCVRCNADAIKDHLRSLGNAAAPALRATPARSISISDVRLPSSLTLSRPALCPDHQCELAAAAAPEDLMIGGSCRMLSSQPRRCRTIDGAVYRREVSRTTRRATSCRFRTDVIRTSAAGEVTGRISASLTDLEAGRRHRLVPKTSASNDQRRSLPCGRSVVSQRPLPALTTLVGGIAVS